MSAHTDPGHPIYEAGRRLLADHLAAIGRHNPDSGFTVMVNLLLAGKLMEVPTWVVLQLLADLRANADEIAIDAERFRALMRCPRIKMQGSAGVNPKSGDRKYPDRPGGVHFGAEFWPLPSTDPRTGEPREYPDCTAEMTQWGRYALRALADDILAVEAAALRARAHSTKDTSNVG